MSNNYQSILLRITRMCAMLLAVTLFGNSDVLAQSNCSPDIVAPQLVCSGSYTLVLDGNGQGSVALSDVMVSVMDNCGNPTVTLSGNAFDCNDVGVGGLMITVTATDGGGNSSSCMTDITVVDGTAPALTVPPAATYECVLPAMQPLATATDGCGIASLTSSDGPQSSPNVPYSFTRTYTATDVNGLTTTGSQLISVEDTGLPTITIDPVAYPLTQNVTCDNTTVTPPTVTAMDACAGTLGVTTSTVSTQGTNSGAANFYNYTLTTTYTTDDGAGNTASLSTEVVVSDTEEPMFTSGLPTSGTISTSGSNPAGACFAAFSADYTSDVIDNCAAFGDLGLSYMIIDQSNTNNPVYLGSGLTVSENLSTGVYEVLFTAVDPAGNAGSFSYMLTVDDGNAPTVLWNPTSNVSIATDGTGILTPASVDNGSYDDCGPVTLSLSTTMFDCNDIGNGPFPVVFTVTDAAGNESQRTTMVTVTDGSNPSAFCQNISRSLDVSGQTMVTAQDIAAGLISDFDMCGPTTGLVSEDGINFFPSVMLDCTDGASVDLTLQITDGAGNMNTCTSTVTLLDSEAPVASCNAIARNLAVTGSYELTVADSMDLVAGATDNCSIENVTFSRRNFTCADLDAAELANGSDTVHIFLTFYDGAGNTDTCTAVLTLNEVTAPAISCIDQTLSLDANGNLTVTGEELLAGNIYLSTPADDSLTTAMFTATNAYDLSFDFSATSMDAGFDFGYILNGTVTSLVAGNTGGATAGSTTINLNAGQTIAFYTEAQDMVMGGQGGQVWISNLSTSIGTTIPATAISFAGNGTTFYADACGPLTVEVGPVGGPYAATMDFDCSDITSSVTRRRRNNIEIQVTDQAGNSSTCSSFLRVLDQAAPQVVCVAQTLDLNQTGSSTLQASSFDNGSSMDACDGRNITFSFVDAFGADLGTTLTMTCDSVGTRDIYIAATDQSGNIGYCQTSAMVNDNLGPQISAPANILSQDCSESIDPTNTGLATAVDNCDGAVSVTYTDQTMPGGNRNCRTIRRRFSAIDSRGNISFAFQDITIEDNEAPVFTADVTDPGYIDPLPRTSECVIPAAVTPSITDNCDNNVTDIVLDTIDSRIRGGVFVPTAMDARFYNFNIRRTWTATDSCGNSDLKSQLIRVRDREAPVFDASIVTVRQIPMDVGVCSATVRFDLTGLVSDACAASNVLTVTNDAPMGDGAYIAEGTYAAGTYSILFTAQDPAGNMSSLTINFEVKDMAAPVATCNSGINLSLNNQGVATLSVSQLDNGSNDNCGIASYQISQSTFTCADIGFKRITLTVTDFSGNTGTCTTNVIISETNSPVFSSTPADITVDCSDDINNPAVVGSAAALTACGTAATITSVDVTTAGTFDNCRTISRTYTATSPSGLTTTYVQEIVVEDNTVPTYDNAPLAADRRKTFECVADPLPVITASDDCGVQPLVTTTFDISTQGTDPSAFDFYNYSLQRGYSASDGCNTASQIIIVYTVLDTEDPIVSVSDQTIAADMGACQGTINIDLAAVTADCADVAFINFTNDSGIGNGANLINGVLSAGVYPINYTATDPSGNQASGTFTITIEDQTGPNVICQNVVTSLVNGSASVAASDVLVSSTDNCTATSNLTFSLDQTTFTAPGDYPVVLTVTDLEGNASNCSSIVTVMAPLTVTAGSASGISGSTVQLGINALNFTNVTGLSGTVSLATLPVADFVNNITYNPIFNAADWAVFVNDDVLTFTYSGTSQVSLPATGANLFMIDVELDGVTGDMTNVIIDGSSTQFSAVQNIAGTNVVITPATGTPGVVTVIGNGTNATISGALKTSGGAEIALADVGYLGTSSGTLTTGAPGTYIYSVPMGGTTTVSPFKDINYSNGVDIIDLFDLRQHVLTNPAKQINDPYSRIAADVAPDGNINILDIIEVQQTVLDPINYEFTSNTSWRFVLDGQPLVFTPNSTDVPAYEESATFSNIVANIADVNFTGVKIADINGTATASTLTNGGVLQGRTANTLEFIVQDQALVAGETYEVALRTRDFIDVLGYQFTLSLDGGYASLDGVQPGVLAGMSTSNFNLASSELLTHVWDNATEIDYVDGETVFTITLTASTNGMLSEVLDMNSQLTPAIAYGQDRSEWDIDLVFEQVSSTSTVLGESFSLSQNRPNPYSGSTQIDFTLPSADDVVFQVVDVNGRVVLTRNFNGVAGKQTIELAATELPAAGVYHYQLITSDASATKSMILTK